MTISGNTVEQGQSGSSPLAGVAVAAYDSSNDSTPLATATSDAQGHYTLTVNAAMLDGYLKVTKSGYVDTYLYPPAPLDASATVDASLLSSSTFGLLALYAGADSSQGTIITIVQDAAGHPVAGAKVSSTPAAGIIRYSDGTGAPSGTTSTSADGTAFFFNLAPGDVTITATKSGASFQSHVVGARANALVTTEITE